MPFLVIIDSMEVVRQINQSQRRESISSQCLKEEFELVTVIKSSISQDEFLDAEIESQSLENSLTEQWVHWQISNFKPSQS